MIASLLANVQLRVIAALIVALSLVGAVLYVKGLRSARDAAEAHAASVQRDLEEVQGRLEGAQREIALVRANEARNVEILTQKEEREKELLAEVERYRKEESNVARIPVPAECAPACGGFVAPVVRAVGRVRSNQNGLRGGPGAAVPSGSPVSGRPARP